MSRIDPSRARPSSVSPSAVPPPIVTAPAAAKLDPTTGGSKDSYVAGKSVGQPSGQPADPLAQLSEIRKRRAVRSAAVQGTETRGLSLEQMQAKAREAIVRSFERDFVPSAEFQDVFNAGWAEVKDQVLADAKTFGSDPEYEDADDLGGGTTFMGRIYGLYTEVTVREDGSVERPYFEID